jgi:hypothetical protein
MIVKVLSDFPRQTIWVLAYCLFQSFYFISVLGQAADREFLIRVSYMEIYNEEINDLLTLGSEKLPIHESLEVNVINDYSFSSYYLIDSVRIYIVATARCVCVRPAGRDC